MMVFENIRDVSIRNHWVRAMADVFHDLVPVYVKGTRLVYLQAALKLVSSDPDGFWINGFSFDNIQFYDHKMKGKKCVYCKAKYDHICEHLRTNQQGENR